MILFLMIVSAIGGGIGGGVLVYAAFKNKLLNVKGQGTLLDDGK